MRRCVGSPRTWASSAARCASGRPGTLPGVRPAPTAGRRPARCVHAGPTTPGRAGRRRRLPGRRSRAWRRRTLSLTLRPSSPARGAGGIPSAGGRACLAGGDDPIEPVPRFVEDHRDAYEVKRLRAGRGGGARHFTAPASNRRYVGDIPPLRGRCPLLPAPGRRDEPVPGYRHRLRTAGAWSPGRCATTCARPPLVIEALQQAAATRGSLKGAVLHAGHGSVHTSKDFAAECKRLEVTQSMGAVGSSAAGAPAESFNATLKREVLTGEHSWTDELTRRRQTLQVAHPRTTPYAATPTAATHPQPPTRNRPQPLRRQPPRKPTPVSNNKRQGPTVAGRRLARPWSGRRHRCRTGLALP